MFTLYGYFFYSTTSVLVVIIIYAINKFSQLYMQTKRNGLQSSSPEDEALRILNMRFANGEITEEEYERKKKLLLSQKG
jgi:putative membrane protein